MPLYRVGTDALVNQPIHQFASLGLRERDDLQRLIKSAPDVLGEELFIVAEEFGGWADANRRIDLLALDSAGRLVVIELKRTDDGGHMELQALRYAAMVSSMNLDDVVRATAKDRSMDESEAQTLVSEFLGLESEADADAAVSTDVRIILVSAGFGREITTAVLWLNRFDGMDIRCVQLIPYEIAGVVYLDIRQILPLPEAGDYQVQLRRKESAHARRPSGDGRDFTRYHVLVDGNEGPAQNKRNSVRTLVAALAEQGIPLSSIQALLRPRQMKAVDGELHDRDAIIAALEDLDSSLDIGRLYTEYPLHDGSGKTFVLTRMWGRNTEPTMRALCDSFPEAKCSFREAEA